MASWLKKSSSEITLYHTSDLPYHIADSNVLICDSNLFTEEEVKTDNYIGFNINIKLAKRHSANYWRLNSFPYKVSKNKILSVFNGPKSAQAEQDTLRVVAIKSLYAKKVSEQKVYDIIDNYDKSFLFSKRAGTSSKICVAAQNTDSHFCCDSWYGAVLNILDNVCLASTRGENWVRNIPDITLEVYGIEGAEELDSLHRALVDFNVLDKIDLSVR